MPSMPPPFHLPRVGVVITCYNYRDYVEDSIRSVLTQTYENWECVIVDDASSDGSAERIREILETIGDSRFELIARTTNGGQLVAFRAGFFAVDAPFVAFLDADDVWLPDYLLAHISAHMGASHPVALSSSDVLIIDRDRNLLAGTYVSLAKPGRSLSEKSVVAAPADTRLLACEPSLGSVLAKPLTYYHPETFGWMWSPTSAMVFRRGALEGIMAFPAKAQLFGSDYLLASCSHLIGGSVLIQEPMGLYRRHGANMSSQSNYAGGHLGQSASQRAYKELLDEDILEFALQNGDLLNETNGMHFMRTFLLYQFGVVDKLAAKYSDDPRVNRFMTGRSRWWWLRKRMKTRLRKLIGW